jgi:hypothetical protein
MKLTGENTIQASRLKVWEALNSAEVLKATIPGAQTVEKSSDDEFKAVVEVKIGPVKAKFTGKINLTDMDPPKGYKIVGQGQGGAAGFAKGSAVVNLIEEETFTTKLTYEVDAQVGGKLAQVGQRLIQSASKSLADQFFNNLENYFNTDEDKTQDILAEDIPKEDAQDKVLFFNIRRNKVIFVLIVFLLSFLYFYNK